MDNFRLKQITFMAKVATAHSRGIILTPWRHIFHRKGKDSHALASICSLKQRLGDPRACGSLLCFNATFEGLSDQLAGGSCPFRDKDAGAETGCEVSSGTSLDTGQRLDRKSSKLVADRLLSETQ